MFAEILLASMFVNSKVFVNEKFKQESNNETRRQKYFIFFAEIEDNKQIAKNNFPRERLNLFGQGFVVLAQNKKKFCLAQKRFKESFKKKTASGLTQSP